MLPSYNAHTCTGVCGWFIVNWSFPAPEYLHGPKCCELSSAPCIIPHSSLFFSIAAHREGPKVFSKGTTSISSERKLPCNTLGAILIKGKSDYFCGFTVRNSKLLNAPSCRPAHLPISNFSWQNPHQPFVFTKLPLQGLFFNTFSLLCKFNISISPSQGTSKPRRHKIPTPPHAKLELKNTEIQEC